MKRIIPISILKMLVVICLFVLGTAYSQDKKQSDIILFGKQITPETINPKNGVIRCASTEYEKMLQEKNPKRMTQDQFESWLAPLVQKNATMRTAQTNTVITIPVVVHVIYNGQAVGIAPNITDAQVQSQITVLNQDFGRTGPGFNTNPVGVDTQIQFVLAKQDPNGNPTNGIDRVSFGQESWSTTEIESKLKPATIWDPTQYLNLWSVNLLTDLNILGYAQFPDASGLVGISGNGIAKTDGVVIKYNAFGSGSGSSFLLKAPYNKGRTTTHEIGHWLGLIHIWGDGSNCNTNTDYCLDTPVAKDPNYGCPTGTDSCKTKTGLDMIENYMDYTDDSCMNIFTKNQKDRMDAVMTNSPRRKSLKTSTKGDSILLFANDAEVKFESSSVPISCGTNNVNQTTQKIIIYNRGNTPLTSVTGSYTINVDSAIPFLWTGSLATNEFAALPITISSNINGTIDIQVNNANGFTDERVANNKATGSFTLPSAPTNYAFTNYIFSLQQDYYGSETTWNIKNASGTILYSGGPYTDTYVNSSTVSPIPALITQKWVLDNNQCYTFTINDSAGDGICCGTGLGDSGTGYYEIKTADGLTEIAWGASFTTSESKSFATDSFLKTFYDKDEYVNEKCKFVIPDYKSNSCDDAPNCENLIITQEPPPGDIIMGIGTITRITLNAYDSKSGKSESKTFDITLKEKDTFLFPNPAKETIKISTSCSISYTIANSLGQIVLQKEVSAASDLNIDTSTLSTGIYFITITKENQKKTLRFIKD